MNAPPAASTTYASSHAFSELEWARKIASAMLWDGEFVILPPEPTLLHILLRPGNAAQHWTASSARIRQELDYQEPVAIEDAIRRTISWERENPPNSMPLRRNSIMPQKMRQWQPTTYQFDNIVR